MIFSKDIIGNSRMGKLQWNEVNSARTAYNLNEARFEHIIREAGFRVNEGIIPQDVFQEFDNITVTRMRSDDGDTFLNDLLPMSRSVNIGRLTSKFRQASDAGQTQTSMTGQIGVKMDQVEYKFDGTIIPIHDTGFGRNWREFNAQSAEGFDALIDDQRESVAALRRKLVSSFLDGHLDADGNTIELDLLKWEGMRNDERVQQVVLTFDFTDQTKTFEDIQNAFKQQIRDILWIDNNCGADVTYYVSREIASAFERMGSDFNPSQNKVIERLSMLQGVAAIKATSALVDNEIMGFPLNGDSVMPIVGMGVNTVAMPRAHYNDNFNFAVWAAIGFSVREDFFGNTCAIFAAS